MTIPWLPESGAQSVTIPPGDYEIDYPLVIPKDRTDVFGYNAWIRPSKKFPNGQPMLIASGKDRNNRRNRIRIKGLVLDGNSRPVIGFYSNHTFMLSLDEVSILSCNGVGAILSNAMDAFLGKVDIRNCGSIDGTGPACQLTADPPPIEGYAPNHPGSNTINIWYTIIERYRGTALLCDNQTVVRFDCCKFHGLNRERELSRVAVKLINCDRVRIANCHSILAKDLDFQIVDSNDVIITGQISSQGRTANTETKATTDDV